MVLKVSPPAGVPVLRYEQDLLAAEAAYLRLVRTKAPHVPVPSVLHHGRSVLDGEWLVTRYLPGTLLTQCRGSHDSAVREELGTAMAHLHRVSGPRFGYTGDRPHGTTWRAAFTAMIESLLADARDWEVDLPASPERLRDLFGRDAPVLDLVRRPALVHFDLWDGNLLTPARPGWHPAPVRPGRRRALPVRRSADRLRHAWRSIGASRTIRITRSGAATNRRCGHRWPWMSRRAVG